MGYEFSPLIENSLLGYSRDFNRLPIVFEPILSAPSEFAYPHVATFEILDAAGNPRADQRFAMSSLWRITYNRDMDNEFQPFVAFGPDVPYTDFSVSGDWIDARTWEGRVTISPVATDGYHYVKISGAVAADDPWLVTGDDKRRFRFEVIRIVPESSGLRR